MFIGIILNLIKIYSIIVLYFSVFLLAINNLKEKNFTKRFTFIR